MRDSDIPVKTEAGRRELAERRHGLSPRQRSLLIAIHGEYPLHALRQQFHALGDIDALVDELVEAGLVATLVDAAAQAAEEADYLGANGTDTVGTDLNPLQLTRKLMNETAVAALGLRAFLFTLKLEKCYTRGELTALMPEYRRVMAKARDSAFAQAMVERVAAMLARA